MYKGLSGIVSVYQIQGSDHLSFYFCCICFYFVKGIQKPLLQGAAKLRELTKIFQLQKSAFDTMCLKVKGHLWHSIGGSRSPHLGCCMNEVLQLWNSQMTLTLERHYGEPLTDTLLQEHEAVYAQMWTLLFPVHW